MSGRGGGRLATLGLVEGIFSLARRSLSVYGRGQFCPGGEIGKHIGLKIQRRLLLAGSSPARGTAAPLIPFVKEAVFRAVVGIVTFVTTVPRACCCHLLYSKASATQLSSSLLRERKKGSTASLLPCSVHGADDASRDSSDKSDTGPHPCS